MIKSEIFSSGLVTLGMYDGGGVIRSGLYGGGVIDSSKID
tara:strand:- start:1627 stop:1746 length:120 start_codon:yes stop_codon:yes gene_type:complete